MKSVLEVLLAAFLTAVVTAPIILSYVSSSDVQRQIILCVAVVLLSALVSWRTGAMIGSGSAIIVTSALFLLSPDASRLTPWEFIAVLVIIPAVLLVKLQILKWAFVLVIAVTIALFHQSIRAGIAVAVLAVGTNVVVYLLQTIKSETAQALAPLQNNWSPIVAYISLGLGVVTVFAMWYRLAFLYSPETAFQNMPLNHSEVSSSWIRSLPIFLYQSVLVFATEGPPYPPANAYTRMLVGFEALSSILLLGLYLNLLVNRIAQDGRSR